MEKTLLNKYQQILLDMRTSLLGRIEGLEQDKRRKYGALAADFSEQATQLMNDKVVDSLDHIELAELTNINRALIHMQNNRYGLCDTCGESIQTKRLEALPFATECIKCVMEYN